MNGAMILRSDNHISLKIALEAPLANTSKNTLIFHHFIRDAIEQIIICVQYVPREDNRSDTLTKGLGQGLPCNRDWKVGIALKTTENGVPLLKRSDGLWYASDLQGLYVRKLAY